MAVFKRILMRAAPKPAHGGQGGQCHQNKEITGHHQVVGHDGGGGDALAGLEFGGHGGEIDPAAGIGSGDHTGNFIQLGNMVA